MPYADPIKEKLHAKKRKEKYMAKPPYLFNGNKIVNCKCGCGNTFWLLDNHHRKRNYSEGHRKFWLGKKRPRGEMAVNWQGGITPINAAIRNSFEYEEWRKKVFERDLYTCQGCREVGGYLQADHIKPFSSYPELRLEVSNEQTLCKDCHKLKTILDWKEGQIGQQRI